jgi:hypothetical protein
MRDLAISSFHLPAELQRLLGDNILHVPEIEVLASLCGSRCGRVLQANTNTKLVKPTAQSPQIWA